MEHGSFSTQHPTMDPFRTASASMKPSAAELFPHWFVWCGPSMSPMPWPHSFPKESFWWQWPLGWQRHIQEEDILRGLRSPWPVDRSSRATDVCRRLSQARELQAACWLATNRPNSAAAFLVDPLGFLPPFG